MARGGFVALVQTRPDAETSARFQALAARFEREGGWKPAGATDRLRLWVGGDAPPPVRALPLAAGYVIGDIFPTAGASSMASPLEDPAAACRNPLDLARRLSRAHWGRYVALLHGPPPATTAAFRDPSGAMGCQTWQLGDGLDVVASDMLAAPPWLSPRRLSLNWSRIARYMAIPSASTTAPLFDGLEAVGPGELSPIGDPRRSATLVWSPGAFVGDEARDPVAVGEALVACVDRCTDALAGGYDKLMVEVSGGLDSAIVAAAVAQTGHAGRVVDWLNRVGDRAESDETVYARAVTDRLGAELTTVVKPAPPLDAAMWAEMGSTLWPAITASDAGTDRDAARRLRASGARGLLSGQGGDAVFFQMPTALVAADAFRREGLAALASPLLADVARRTRRSVWAVLGEIRADRRGRAAPTMSPSPLVSADVRAAFWGAEHRWVEAARSLGVTPAKRLQIETIANCQIYYDDSRRHREADPLFPLLAQPVVELCLSIPAPELGGSAFDRLYVRRAFAARLPEAVRTRRAKGNMNAFFAHLIADNLDVLRPHLLDGCLCEAGVLDRDALDRALSRDHLIWMGQGTEILWAATVESWVRYWQGRVPDSEASPRRTL